MSNSTLFFSFQGRISRKLWGYGTFMLCCVSILLALAQLIMAITPVAFDHEYNARVFLQLLMWIGGISTLWSFLAVGGKRLHDLGRSAWWNLLHLAPGLGTIILLFALGLVPGDTYSNIYGEAQTE